MVKGLIQFLKVIHLTIFLGILPLSNCLEVPNTGNETDKLALIDFKNRLTSDPFQVTNSWNDSVDICRWVGVICNPSNGRVGVLNLEGKQLVGSIPPSIGNLTFLTGLNLRNNSLLGEIPNEIGRLLSLQHLNLSLNSFVGKIPTNLSNCVHLKVLHLVHNQLVGQIPDQLRSLTSMYVLGLGENNLTGTIPTWIGNFSSLFALSLHLNSLQGTIPNEFGKLSNLGIFQLYGNKLTGMIPPSIFNISSIYYFSVTQNNLHGEIPNKIGLMFPNLKVFAGAVNSFTGTIPSSLANASALQVLDFSFNNMTGTVPSSLGNLQSLYRINFDVNRLGENKLGGLNFISYLANCSSLQVLGLAQNRFGGELPQFIGNLSNKLGILTLGSNKISRKVPYEIGNLVNLALLGLEGNEFSGSIPESIGKLHLLEGLELNGNKFSGRIPSTFRNLTTLTRLLMDENRLEGSIPPSLGDCKNLLVLNMSNNNLNGSIPKEVIGLSSLSISLALINNSLSGPIPFEVGNLKNLKELDLSDNKLSGEIPSSLGSCISMEHLRVKGNFLQGDIPKSLENLRGIEEMDFSDNTLSGKFPDFLGKLPGLKELGLSDNNLEGKVPSEGIFANASAVSITGNKNLCGGVEKLNLPTCTQDKKRSSNKFLIPKIVVPVAVGVVSTILLCSLVFCYRIKRPRNTNIEDHQLAISYAELAKATNGFSEENLIGSGSFGSVYKGCLNRDNNVVAVKVLNLQKQGADKSFKDECNALTSVKHRNLLKIVTACSSIDHQGHEFKALVFEFMPKGNLDQWLHPQDHTVARLDIKQRLDIAIDVASALEYLHHHCETPIVHCDLKPSNILLDDDMTAHVADFGLSRFIIDEHENHALSIQLKGSIGYIAPENGMGGQSSTLGDVYSYGILLLEMFTGQRPTDEAFTNENTIQNFVSTALPDHVMDVLDPSLLECEWEIDSEEIETEKEGKLYIEDEDHKSIARSDVVECLASVFRIGLLCSSLLPRERLEMNVVVNKMHSIRKSLLRFQKSSCKQK